MKKRVLLVFFICFLFLLSGCENKTKKAYEVAAEKVSQEILDTDNISISKIEKALNYIINNYETVRKASDNYSEIVEYAEYLEQLGAKNSTLEKHLVTQIGTSAKAYLKSFSNKNKKTLEEYLSKIESTAKVAKEFNNLYHQEITIKDNASKASEKIEKLMKEQNSVTEEKIKKALNYISINYESPQKNSEVSEKLSYYAEYLTSIGNNSNCTNNLLVKLGTSTKSYLLNQNSENKKNIKEIIATINQNQSYYITELNTLYNS